LFRSVLFLRDCERVCYTNSAWRLPSSIRTLRWMVCDRCRSLKVPPAARGTRQSTGRGAPRSTSRARRRARNARSVGAVRPPRPSDDANSCFLHVVRETELDGSTHFLSVIFSSGDPRTYRPPRTAARKNVARRNLATRHDPARPKNRIPVSPGPANRQESAELEWGMVDARRGSAGR